MSEFERFFNINFEQINQGYQDLIRQLNSRQIPRYFCLADFRWYVDHRQCTGRYESIDKLAIRKGTGRYVAESDLVESYAFDLFRIVKVSAQGDARGQGYFAIYDISSDGLIYDYDNHTRQFYEEMEYYGHGQHPTSDMTDWFHKLYRKANPRATPTATPRATPRATPDPFSPKIAPNEEVIDYVKLIYGEFLSEDHTNQNLLQIIQQKRDEIEGRFWQNGYIVDIDDLIVSLSSIEEPREDDNSVDLIRELEMAQAASADIEARIAALEAELASAENP